MKRKTWPKSTIVDGWNLFERWARNFKKSCLRREKTPALLWYSDIAAFVVDGDEDLQSFDYSSINDTDKRIRDQLGFLRGYLVDISFDQGPFAEWVKQLLCNHNNRDWKKGYSFFLYQNDLEKGAPFGDSFHFQGTCANFFCNRIADIDFASAMSVLPFDRLTIRNKEGRNWSATEANKVIAEIEKDLEFDLMGVGLTEDLLFGSYLFLYASEPWWRSRKKAVAKKHKKNRSRTAPP
jgi:hypothetical protein